MVGEAFAREGAGNVVEAVWVVPAPRIEPKDLLIQVAVQVERLHADVGAFDGALEQRPKIFNPVCGDMIPDIFLGVVNDLVDVGVLQTPVADILIRVDFAGRLNTLADFLVQCGSLRVREHRGLHPAFPLVLAAFEQPHDGRLACTAGPGDLPGLHGLVHEPRLAVDEGFIRFDLAGQATGGAVLHGVPNPMQHEPRGFLGHAERPVQLVGRDPVLAVGEQPDRGQPLAQRDRAVFHDRADLDTELPPGMFGFALPALLLGEIVDLGIPAGRAGDALRPALGDQVVDTALLVTEKGDGLLEGARLLLCHAESVANTAT